MALALAEIESRIGRADFDRALALFARRPRLGPERGDDLLRALGTVTGEDLSVLWSELTGRPGLPDVGIAIAASRPDPSRPGVEQGQVTLAHRGGPRLPVSIDLLFADGSRRRVAWEGRDDWLRIRSEGPRLVAVRLDPDRASALARSRVDDARLVDPDPRPRRRVLQRQRFLAQLFLEALADLA
jgi:aminopeptidase N